MNISKDIADRYRSMSDKQLTDLYEFEIGGLIPDAREILIQEMKARNIMPSLEENAIQATYFSPNKTIVENLLGFYESGWTIYQLKGYMMERNFSEEEIEKYLEILPKSINERLAAASKGITNGIVVLVIGLSVAVLPLHMYNNSGVLLMAYAAIGIGGLKTAHSIFIKRKMKKALERWATLLNDTQVIAFPVGEEGGIIDQL